MCTEENPLLKKTRYIWLKKERVKKAELSMPNLNLKSSRAMYIRENFQAIYLAKNIDEPRCTCVPKNFELQKIRRKS